MKYHIFHLSHTDLDGYGCQYITKQYFENIRFYNSNYGKEIDERYNQILNDIVSIDAEVNIILITDLNLTLEQCKAYEDGLSNINKPVRLLLLDHHQSGEECAKTYPWYLLDSSRCATKITYDFFSELYGKDNRLARLVNVINAVDIWISDDKDFELGKVCLGMVANAKELNRIMFDEENTNYMFSLLAQSLDYLDKKDAHIALDDNMHFMKKNFFKEEQNDTLSNLISNYNVTLLSKLKDKMTINYKGSKGILTFNIGNVSVIGNEFLVKNEDYHFFMDVTSRKTVSFRSNGKADVSKIAGILANGGGHVNASGGSLTNFRDSFLYDIIKKQVDDLIKSKEL
ncbi:MAG: DHH family phosphoesterase [Campylobacteraceae bacterium]